MLYFQEKGPSHEDPQAHCDRQLDRRDPAEVGTGLDESRYTAGAYFKWLALEKMLLLSGEFNYQLGKLNEGTAFEQDIDAYAYYGEIGFRYETGLSLQAGRPLHR